MKTPSELQRDVLDELDFDPVLDAAGIGVSVTDGVVTLNGNVRSYADKIAAETTVKRVAGVKGVANDLKVELWPGTEHDDTRIARAAVSVLDWSMWVPKDAVTVTVKDGWVTLEGTVDWQYQREAALRAVGQLSGVKGVTSLMRVKPRVLPTDVERRIQSAFQRTASLDAKHVHVDTVGSRVVLRGQVRTWAEREDADRAAWSVPGVTEVENDLVIGVSEYAAA
jgi:osmotically-inducible protein OsmY